MKFYCSLCNKEREMRSEKQGSLTVRSYWHKDDGSAVCSYAEIIKREEK